VIVDTNTAKMIHDLLADDLSRRVFTKRLAYSMVDSMENIRELARFHIPEFIDNVMGFVEQGNKVCVYAVGDADSYWHPGRLTLTLFNDHLAKLAVVDKQAEQLGEIYYCHHREKSGFASIKVHSPEKIQCLDPNTIVIVAAKNPIAQREIAKELVYSGISLSKVIFFPTSYYACPNDYFCHSFWKFGINEIFVDCGCFDGNTSRMFIEALKCQPDASVLKIFAYEPDEKNFIICKQNMADIPFFSVIKAGLWNKNETLSFFAFGNLGSQVGSTGDTMINAVALDDELADQKITIIKLDVEGAELNALKGTVKLIRNQRPKLAISVYHRAKDILTIPEFIINLNLNYKLYLRHQSAIFFETVLYAVPQ
jgi:FkbM family methyltransferase